MYTNRLFTLLAVGALVAVAVFTVREAIATNALVADDSYDSIEYIRAVSHPASKFEVDGGYDLIEQLRGNRAGVDSSYDLIEQVRIGRTLGASADRSYESVEQMRTTRSYVESKE